MDIALFRQQLLNLFDYDREAGKLYWKVSPSNVVKAGKEAGRIDNKGYRRVRIDGKLYLVHRLIFLLEHGYLPDYIDHKDGDRLNNRIKNLRPASRSENQRNKSKYSNNTSGIVGVCWDKNANKWKAQCRDRNGKNAYLGYFHDINKAAEVVRAFRLEHHGQFAGDLRAAA